MLEGSQHVAIYRKRKITGKRTSRGNPDKIRGNRSRKHQRKHEKHNLSKYTKVTAKEERFNKESNSHIILATAQVYIRDGQGRRQTCRVLLDPGSQLHFITEDLVKRLQLSYKGESLAFNGIMRNSTQSKRSTKVQIESKNTTFKTELDYLVSILS